MHVGSTIDLFRHLHRSPFSGFSSADQLLYEDSTVTPPVPETDRLELSNAHKLESVKNKVQAKNLEVESFMKSITSILEAMKGLAKLAEREQLVQDERLELQEEMTRLQHRLSRTVRKMKLVVAGQTEEQAERNLGYTDTMAHTMLKVLSNVRNGTSSSENSGIHEQGDGTASIEIFSFIKMPDRGNGIKIKPDMTIKDIDRAQEEAQQKYHGIVTEYGMRITGKTEDIKKLYEDQFSPLRRLSLKEIMENASLRLDSVKNAADSVKRIEEELRKLPDMQAPLDDAYSQRDVFVRFYAGNGEPKDKDTLPTGSGLIKEDGTDAFFDPIFRRLEALGISSALQGNLGEILI